MSRRRGKNNSGDRYPDERENRCVMSTVSRLKFIHQQLQQCRACPRVCGTPVHGVAIETPIMLVGQAPGTHEARLGRPFAYTAGKTLFKWLGGALNMDEEEIRERVYFAAVARCFPGKSPKGTGDREPDAGEVENCRRHLREEVAALRPRVVLAVGRVAMAEVLGPKIFRKAQSSRKSWVGNSKCAFMIMKWK